MLPRVGNTRYVRFMYQMICPVLERLQAMEGGDASDGAGTDTVRRQIKWANRVGLVAEALALSD